MTEAKHALYKSLSAKLMTLYAHQQALLAAQTAANKPDIDIALGRADLEVKLVEAMLDELLNDAPMAFPSHDLIKEMQETAAALQAAVDAGAAVEDLIAAADQVIKAWPKAGN